MKKGVLFIIYFILIISLLSVSADITGEAITGEATSQQFGLSIFINPIIPYIAVISPKNQTYLTNESILLNYTIINGDFIWYNLDNSENITINSSVHFNASQGIHSLYIYSNNTNATVMSQITFTANSSKLNISFDNYKGNTKGSSTNFLNYTYEELQSLENVILENTDSGKIQFNEATNLTDDKNATDNSIDLDSNIKISQNKIEINSENLPNFNKSAILSLYNLNFVNPRILKDNSVCPPTICTKESYTGNILRFNVTGFSVYSSEETPSGEITPPSEQGKQGGGTSLRKYAFSVDSDKITTTLKSGETKEERLIIKNTGKQTAKFSISVEEKIEDLIKLSESSFELLPSEEKEITLDIIAKQNLNPDIYIGKLIINGVDIKKEVLFVIEIESKKALFDLKIDIPGKFLAIDKGEELIAKLELYNLGEIEKVDVIIGYYIKDKEGKEILHESETLAVENRANFIKRFSVPDDIEYGDYILYVKVVYQGETASASSWFSVQKRKITSGQRILIIIASLVIIAMILAEILDLIKRLKIKSEIEKEKRMKKKKEEEVSPDKYIFPNKSRKK